MRTAHWVWLPVAAISTSAYATTYLTVEQAQRTIFPGATFVSAGEPNVWRASTGGLFVVDRVVGKHEFITVAIGINTNGTVKQIEIMDYRESYGYEVREAAWFSNEDAQSVSLDTPLSRPIAELEAMPAWMPHASLRSEAS